MSVSYRKVQWFPHCASKKKLPPHMITLTIPKQVYFSCFQFILKCSTSTKTTYIHVNNSVIPVTVPETYHSVLTHIDINYILIKIRFYVILSCPFLLFFNGFWTVPLSIQGSLQEQEDSEPDSTLSQSPNVQDWISHARSTRTQQDHDNLLRQKVGNTFYINLSSISIHYQRGCGFLFLYGDIQGITTTSS